jgi:hypothetical protein
MPLEIAAYTPSKDPASKTVAEFCVHISEWDLSFAKMKLIRTLKGNLFVSGPSYKITMSDGKDEFRPYWAFGRDTNRRFMDSVLKLVNEYIEKTYGPAQAQPTPQTHDEEIPF